MQVKKPIDKILFDILAGNISNAKLHKVSFHGCYSGGLHRRSWCGGVSAARCVAQLCFYSAS